MTLPTFPTRHGGTQFHIALGWDRGAITDTCATAATGWIGRRTIDNTTLSNTRIRDQPVTGVTGGCDLIGARCTRDCGCVGTVATCSTGCTRGTGGASTGVGVRT